ncbi:MAG: sugar phosphate isomerase/epimerase [Oscillospiraceae bacterium]|nr:sugar phosphate isomerase/epimerase [Oscillospiraceae bacterium]
MKINIGTYSFGGIASYLGLGPSLREKFRTIRSLGFDGVELLPPDLEENSAEDIRSWAQESGLEIVSVHAMPTEETVKKLAAVGGKAVIWAMTAFNCREEAIEVARELDAMAEMAAPYGIKVGYHNHSQEFFVDQGKTLLEHVIENSSKCYFQLDCGWAQNGGCYPPTFIREHLGRFVAIHVKENSKVQGPGPRPASRRDRPAGNPLGDVKRMSLEERQKLLEGFTARQNTPEEKARFAVQCKMGAPESNMNWQEIKNALDEQDFEAFWVIEREGFYDEHDKCIAEDAAYIHNFVK